MFRLAWSERGAPRRDLPVFRLAWSERGAPRRSCAVVGASGAPGVYMGRRPAGRRPGGGGAYAQGMLQRQRLAARCALRGQRVPKVRTKPGIAAASIGVDLQAGEQRFAMEGFRPDFPGLPGMGGGV